MGTKIGTVFEGLNFYAPPPSLHIFRKIQPPSLLPVFFLILRLLLFPSPFLDQYYNVDVASRIVRPVTLLTGQTASKAWYKCP